jgi:hypothetical protein
VVAGTAGNEVTFTSSRDDATNTHYLGGGEVAAAAAGDWYGIRIADLDAVSLANAEFRYARGALALEDGGLTTAQLNTLLASPSLTWQGNVTDVSLDRDFLVDIGQTLTVPAGRKLGFAAGLDQQASQPYEIDALSELIVQGRVIANGNATTHIAVRSDDPAPTNPADFYGVRFLDSTDNSISSLSYVDFNGAKYAVAVDSLSGHLFHCTFANSEKADVYIDRDTRVVEGHEWNLDAPTVVEAAPSDASPPTHAGKDPARVEIVVSGTLTTQGVGGQVQFRSGAASPAAGDWYGIRIGDLDDVSLGNTLFGDARGAVAIEDPLPTTAQLNTLFGSTGLSFSGNVADVTFDRDVLVDVDQTLTVPPGWKVGFGPTATGSINHGKSAKSELVVKGQILADGTTGQPITFRSDQLSPTNADWAGLHLDLVGVTWTGYGYVGSEEPLSSISHATIRDAERGITIANRIAPNLSAVQFANIAGTPPNHILLDSTDVFIPYGAWNAAHTEVEPGPGIWDLDAPMNVVAADSARPTQEIPGFGVPGRVDLIVQGKLFTSGAEGDTVFFRPETETGNATDWGGILMDNTAFAGSAIEYADIGHAANPLFIFYADSLTAVRHSRIHHFADTGVWFDGASGQGGVFHSNTIERGAGVDAALGKRGLYLDQADEMRVWDNRISIAGLDVGGTSAAIEAIFGTLMCNDTPSEYDLLRISGNLVEGPGITLQGAHSGIKMYLMCGSLERKIEIVTNYVTGCPYAGIEFLHTEDVRADSNTVVGSNRAVDVIRSGNVVGPAVRFKANWVEVTRDQPGLSAVRTNYKAKTKLGPASAGRGHNGLMVLDHNVDFMLEEDTRTGPTNLLDANDCYWYLETPQAEELITDIDKVEIFNRLKPNPGDYDVAVIQEDDSNPTYHRMLTPPGVGRAAAPPGVDVVDDKPAEPARAAPSAPSTSVVPDRTELSSPFGHPSRGTVELVLAVAPANVGSFRVEVFDVTGRRVTVLLDDALVPGQHRLQWTGDTASGGRVAAGTYFVRAEGPGFRTTRKLVLLK